MFVAYWQDICEIRKSEETLLSKQICLTQSGCDDTSVMLCEGGKCLCVSGNFAIMLAVNAHSQIAAWEGGDLVNMLVLLLVGCVYVRVCWRGSSGERVWRGAVTSYTAERGELDGGRELFTKKKSASSGLKDTRWRIRKHNWPTKTGRREREKDGLWSRSVVSFNLKRK